MANKYKAALPKFIQRTQGGNMMVDGFRRFARPAAAGVIATRIELEN
jgi:hypothetical protein